MLTPLADISLKATIEMTFGQGRLGWFYSFVKWHTCGGRRDGFILLHVTIHYTAGMCMSTFETDQSYSTGQVMRQSVVRGRHGFVLRLMARRRYTICNVLITFPITGCFNMSSIPNFSEIFADIYRVIQEERTIF